MGQRRVTSWRQPARALFVLACVACWRDVTALAQSERVVVQSRGRPELGAAPPGLEVSPELRMVIDANARFDGLSKTGLPVLSGQHVLRRLTDLKVPATALAAGQHEATSSGTLLVDPADGVALDVGERLGRYTIEQVIPRAGGRKALVLGGVDSAGRPVPIDREGIEDLRNTNKVKVATINERRPLVYMPDLVLPSAAPDTTTDCESPESLMGSGRAASDVSPPSGSVVVAVIDTGVRILDSGSTGIPRRGLWRGSGDGVSVAYGRNLVDDSLDTVDHHGHGTFVAGLIRAVAPSANLMVVKALADTSVREVPEDSALVRAFRYAREGGSKVINISWGTPSYSWWLEQEVKGAIAAGVVVVAAAGNCEAAACTDCGAADCCCNSDCHPVYPASIPGVVSVMATDASGSRLGAPSGASNVSLVANGGSRFGPRTVLLGAPGFVMKRIIFAANTWSFACAALNTSGATALVSGVAARLFERYPGIDGSEVRRRLCASASAQSKLRGENATGAVVDLTRALSDDLPVALGCPI